MEQKTNNDYANLMNAIKIRFPNAQFIISCFNSIDDIENKILTYDDMIIYSDCFFDSYEKPALHDYFIIGKNEGCNAIYYKDVIDYLIKIHFIRNDCDHKFLENIECYNKRNRNENSIKVYNSYWGS